MNAPEPLQDSLVDYFPIDKIHPSPTNPRDAIGDVSDLAASIARMGVLQPILIRPDPFYEGDYEVISGHRRLVAATQAGLEQVPCRLCEVNDEQVAEIQIVENLQRKDLSPMEEARGYQRLQTEFSHSAEQIAERVGKSRAYVYAKLKLLALHQAGRDALAAGQISESIALLVARIPGEDLQAKAIDKLTEEDYRRDAETEPMSFRQAKEVIRRDFTTDLRSAIWKLDDETLVAEVGACWTCPKRSGNSPEAYPDVDDDRTCMDPSCYSVKREAMLARLIEQAEKKGKVVSEKEAQRNLGYGGLAWNSDFVELSAKPAGSEKTWAQLAKANGIEVEREVIVDARKGKTLVVARGEQLKEALTQKGVQLGESSDGDDDDDETDAFEVQAEAFRKANHSIAASSITLLYGCSAVWRAVARSMLMGPAAKQMQIAQLACIPEVVEHATGWQTGAKDMVEAVQDAAMLRRLIAAAVLLDQLGGRINDEECDLALDQYVFHSPEFDATCAEVGIDAPAMRAQILSKPAAEPVPDPSDAAQAADQTAEPASPAKPKRARKGKAAAREATPEQVGSADVNEGAEATHG
jgi:ParB/RepB/Spo0J family partition protein